MKSLCVCSTAFVFLILHVGMTYAAPVECPVTLPAGMTIRMSPDEKLAAGVTAGPTILTVTSDVRFFPNRPPLLARGSKVLGTILESKQAGHFYGKAKVRIALTSILTSDFCEYPIDAKIVEVGKYKVSDGVIIGRGHAKRDAFALVFPPTTIYQLLRTPSRGPKLVVDNEVPIVVKLLQPVSLGQASLERIERETPNRTGLSIQTLPSREDKTAQAVGGPCPGMPARNSIRPVTQANTVVRPVRNLTPYHVSLYMDRKRVAILPPCYGPSMISTPASDFKLEAAGSLVTGDGQKLIGVKILPTTGGDGWDIVPETGEPVGFKAN
jgi:hypothetical protein